MKDCPSRRAYLVSADGTEYVSASDVEDELALAANIVEDEKKEEKVAIDSPAASAGYESLLVQWVLTSQLGHEEEKLQHRNLFHMFLIIKDRRVLTIIDSGSCNNLVHSDFVKKLGLTIRAHSKPYLLQWFNNSGKTKVTRSVCVHFSIGSYNDYADFDIVPMQACSFLLDRPWKFDIDALHHGRTNKYTFMHQNKKITLLPLSPADIRKHHNELAEIVKNDPALDSCHTKHNGIKLKEGVYLATTATTAALYDNHDAPCYTVLCQDV